MPWRRFLRGFVSSPGAGAHSYRRNGGPCVRSAAEFGQSNASAVKEQQLLDQLKVIQGRGTIPDTKSYVLEHPAAAIGANFTPSR